MFAHFLTAISLLLVAALLPFSLVFVVKVVQVKTSSQLPINILSGNEWKIPNVNEVFKCIQSVSTFTFSFIVKYLKRIDWSWSAGAGWCTDIKLHQRSDKFIPLNWIELNWTPSTSRVIWRTYFLYNKIQKKCPAQDFRTSRAPQIW